MQTEPNASRTMQVASPSEPSTTIHFSVHGRADRVPLFLGFPLMATHGEVFGSAGERVLRGYLDRLTDRYRVLLADYPSIGQSDSIPADELTAERVVGDLLAVADAAGFDRFVLWGYSWGGAAALQVALRTDRLTALVMGGWPPVAGRMYLDTLTGARSQVSSPPDSAMAVLRTPEQYAQWVTFYESLLEWLVEEEQSVWQMRLPRLVFYGALGDDRAGTVPLPIASTIRARRSELETGGWQVREIPDRDHSVCLEPDLVVPVVRDFLDRVV